MKSAQGTKVARDGVLKAASKTQSSLIESNPFDFHDAQ